MRTIVSDTSCMIDLRKVALLEPLLALSYTVVMPDTLFHDEWLCLSDAEKDGLRRRGLGVRELPGTSVSRAGEHFNRHRPLKLNDCFALALAESVEESILLTGDGTLRRVAETHAVEVRGVLWVIDELERNGVVTVSQLHEALQILHDDDAVFLPKGQLVRRLQRLANLL